VSGERSVNLLAFCVIAVVVGAVTGIGAVLFRALISVVHNLLFLGHFSTVYNANVHTPAPPWGPFVILAPVLGGLIVVFLVRTFAPEARGHGVPEVMDAIFYKEGRIRPVVAAVKSLASALAIGSGSAVGREGPIIQIGASLPSVHLQFSVPELLDASQARWTELDVTPTIVRLAPGHPESLQSQDCDLLQQMNDSLLPAVFQTLVSSDLDCMVPKSGHWPFSITVVALTPSVPKPGVVARTGVFPKQRF